MTTMLHLGFAMNGLEIGIEEIVEEICAKFEFPTYVEIGVGHGQTLVGISEILSVKRAEWRAIGIDLPNGYSLDQGQVKQNAVDAGLKLDFAHGIGRGVILPPWGQITVILEDSQVVLGEHWLAPVDLALIDGCHGRKCATLDFLCLEPFVPRHGVVMFHDFGTSDIGIPQPHCGTIDVRGACEDLGLLNNQRQGWKFVRELTANKLEGGSNMGVFQRV